MSLFTGSSALPWLNFSARAVVFAAHYDGLLPKFTVVKLRVPDAERVLEATG